MGILYRVGRLARWLGGINADPGEWSLKLQFQL
jgi:hypothetical protein